MSHNQNGAHSPPAYDNAAFVRDGTEGSIPLEPAPRQFLPRIIPANEMGAQKDKSDPGSSSPPRFTVKDRDTGQGTTGTTATSSREGSPEDGKGGIDDGGEGDGRETWGNPIEFLMSCISMSVGLGNVWRFPGTAARNGGGAFLIPYLIVLLVIGRPLYYMDMCMGQFSRKGQVKVWNMVPIFKGIGYGSVIAVICTCSFYCMLMALTVYYFFASFAKDLPWEVCHQDKHPDISCANSSIKGQEAALYFDYTVMPKKLNIDDGLGDMHWRLALCLVFVWVLIFAALVKGVQSSGKVAYFTAVFPYVVLFILLIRGATLKGSWRGMRIFLEPQWDKLGDPKVWYAAVEQCFFSLSAGFGSVIMFSSYNKFRHNVYKDALIISVLDTATSILAGLTVYSVMGNLMEEDGLKESDIAGGPGLAFVLYPTALAKFGWAKQLLSVLFFLMLITLGLGSATSQAGSVITIVCDQFPHWKRWMITLVVCICGNLLGLMYTTQGGLFMLDLIDHYGAGFIVYIMAMLQCTAVCYFYGLNRWCNDIEFMIGHRINVYWKFCWAIVIPFALLANLLYFKIDNPTYKSGDVPYPTVATICGWLLTAFAVGNVPVWGIHAILTRKANGFMAKLKESVRPSRHWGPQKPELRREWQEYRAVEDKKNKWFVIW